MLSTLKNKVIFVTGVSRLKGIGYAIACELSKAGANLFLQGYQKYDDSQPWGGNDVDELLTKIPKEQNQMIHDNADLSDENEPARLFKKAIAHFKHIDCLVLNHAYGTSSTFESLSASEIDIHLIVNVRASLLLAKEFYQQHDGRPGGRMIMMTSGQHLGPMPDEYAYVASKGALHQLTPTLNHLFLKKGITVNTINPGPTDTGYADKEAYDWVKSHMPLGRWGEPVDVARLIHFLLSEEGGWITGQIINSDGGFMSV